MPKRLPIIIAHVDISSRVKDLKFGLTSSTFIILKFVYESSKFPGEGVHISICADSTKLSLIDNKKDTKILCDGPYHSGSE